MHFDPNAAATADSGIFGLNSTESESSLILVPVPWEATTSYGGGTSKGPEAIRQASRQVDLFDIETGKPYESGIHMISESEEIQTFNEEAKALAQKVMEECSGDTERVNLLSDKVNHLVFSQTQRFLKQGKIVGIVGGDHSVPYGAIKAYGQHYPQFGILHIDAHSDLRIAFNGFKYSHASIMYNVLTSIPQVTRLVQVGIRDFCEEEVEQVQTSQDRVKVFYDQQLAYNKMRGKNWFNQCEEIVNELPSNVYISFDIDGLDPALCPGTGTPVPGGLSFHEVTALIGNVVRSGRKIIGFDLNEVSLGNGEMEWNANVGARVLYKLCGWTLVSQRKCAPLGLLK